MSFRLKTILGIGVIEAVLLFILVANSLQFLKNSNEQELSKRASTAATLFATTTKDAVLSSDLASLESFVEEVLKNPGIEYARVLSDEEVLAQKGTQELLEKPFVADTEVGNIKDEIFDTYADIVEGGDVYGRVEIGLSVTELQETFQEATWNTLGIAIFELVLSALFSLLLGSYLTRRLKMLEKAAQQIAKGDLGIQVMDTGKDELSQLAKGFNRMTHNLNKAYIEIQQTQQKLQETNRTLESKVLERTQDLHEKNHELERTMQLLEEEQKKQLQNAYTAGIAENAIGVLHNIGNAITPAFIDIAQLINTHQTCSFAIYLNRFSKTFSQQLEKGTLEPFLKTSPKGQQMLPFIEQLANQMKTHFEDNIKQFEILKERLEHITKTIYLQQKYANFQTEHENFEIATVVNDVSNMMKPTFEQRGIYFITEMAPMLPTVTNDKNKLVQILLNLLKNSVESIDACLQSERPVRPEIALQITSPSADQVRFEVRDTGEGALSATLERAFEFGFSTKNRGSGFGLHDCANFIRANRGEIYLNSPGIGLGATVFFTFPTQHKIEKIHIPLSHERNIEQTKSVS